MTRVTTNVRTRRRFWLPAAICLWLVAVTACWVVLAAHSLTPGALVAPPPLGDTSVPNVRDLSEGCHLLVMAIHPKCPCTNATATEFSRLVARFDSRIKCEVLVYRPGNESDEWTDTRLVRSLRKQPNTHVLIDADGKQAEVLGMTTSGSVVLYSSDGEPRYWGGITPARGHEGDNLGSDAIAAILDGKPSGTMSQPVFGCRIQTATDEIGRDDR